MLKELPEWACVDTTRGCISGLRSIAYGLIHDDGDEEEKKTRLYVIAGILEYLENSKEALP